MRRLPSSFTMHVIVKFDPKRRKSFEVWLVRSKRAHKLKSFKLRASAMTFAQDVKGVLEMVIQ